MDLMDPEEGNQVEEVALSIEETNKLRISLGLKPLNESKSNAKNNAAEVNFANERKRQQRIQERKALIEKLNRDANTKKLNAKLEGKGLGEASDEEGDSVSWAQKHKLALEKRKKKEAKLAMKRAKELDEMDANAAYTAADLAGIKVAHDLTDIKDTVLVLADKGVLAEDDDDILMSTELADADKAKENLERKKGKQAYKGYDDDQFDNPGGKVKLLSHYDDVIDGPVRQGGFVINAEGQVDAEPKEEDISQKLREGAVTLQYEKMQEIKDYYTAEEIASFNKPKKRKKKARHRQQEFDTEIDLAPQADVDNSKMDYEMGGRSNKDNKIEDVNFVDDDDLQEVLGRTRNAALKKKGPMVEAILNLKDDEVDTGTGGLVLSATSEFVNSLSLDVITKKKEAAETITVVVDTSKPLAQDNEDSGSEDGEQEQHEHEEDEIHEDHMDVDAEEAQNEDNSLKHTGAIEEEPLVATGLGATIKLLSKKGFIEHSTPEQREREEKQKKKLIWLAQQRTKEQLRELEKQQEKARNKAKGGKAGGYIDEWKLEEEQRNAERKRLKELEDKFKDYTPDVNIKYTDAHGNNLDAKEAFRYLSHKFHGKYSGKLKTEKRLKKKEDELKMKHILSTESPLGVGSSSEKPKTSAHVVLSVGNRGLLPNNVSFEEAKLLLNNSNNKKKKSKAQNDVVPTPVTKPFITEVVSADVSQAIPSAGREKVAFGLAVSMPKKRTADNAGFEDVVVAKKR
ncbi:hypothetical protein HDU97_004459 [Phlyctochytrium planicorne]|nr:hypothetical protein HDU97_004459 [Phlyctochytrium planicorne]